MQPNPQTTRRVQALAVATALLAGACGSGNTDTTSEPSSIADEPVQHIVEITVENGSVVDDTKRIDIPLGEQLTIRLTADIEDTLHVHGYEIRTDTTADQQSETTFTTNIPGVFEIHLEDLSIQLARLQVS